MTRFERFNAWRRRWLAVTFLLWLGLDFAVFAGEFLRHRFAGALWFKSAWAVLWCGAVFCLLWLVLSAWDRDLKRPSPGDAWTLALAVAWMVSFELRSHPAVVFVVCGLTAAFMWRLSLKQRSPFVIPVAGWLWAGIYPLTVPWPDDQRFLLSMLIGGLVTALQGGADVIAYLLGKRPEWSQPAPE